MDRREPARKLARLAEAGESAQPIRVDKVERIVTNRRRSPGEPSFRGGSWVGGSNVSNEVLAAFAGRVAMSLTRSLGLWALIGLGGTGVVAGPAVAQAQVGPTVVPSCTGCGIPLMWSPDGRSANLQSTPLAWHVHRGCKLHTAPSSQAAMAPLPEGASSLGAGMGGAGMAWRWDGWSRDDGWRARMAPGVPATDLGTLAGGAGAGCGCWSR